MTPHTVPTRDDLVALLSASGQPVNVRRITKWRAEAGAPADLDLAAWASWLRQSSSRRRRAWAEAIDAEIARREKPPADLAAPQPTVDDIEPADDTPAAQEARWRVHRMREQALRAQREREELEGHLVRIDSVERIVRLLGADVVELLTDTVWQQLAPLLDGLTAADRRALRAAHDAGITALRQQIPAAAARRLQAITTSGIRSAP